VPSPKTAIDFGLFILNPDLYEWLIHDTLPNRTELQQISRTRLREVEVLYQNRLYDGAKYLSGYVIETALKARVCRVLDSEYPETGEIAKSFLTHKFDTLVRLGGLQRTLDNELNTNVNFKTNWALVTSWTETFRYKPIGSSSQTDVQDIINALQDKTYGVLTWIKKRW